MLEGRVGQAPGSSVEFDWNGEEFVINPKAASAEPTKT
jgi:hypothetical protein